MESIYKKFRNGDHITDEELEQGIAFFSTLSENLHSLGDMFRLSAWEADRVLGQLMSFKRHRGSLAIMKSWGMNGGS